VKIFIHQNPFSSIQQVHNNINWENVKNN